MPILDDEDEMWRGVEELRSAFRDAGRDPESLGVRVTPELIRDTRGRVDLDRSLEALPGLQKAGASVASFALAACVRRREEIPEFMERLGEVAAR